VNQESGKTIKEFEAGLCPDKHQTGEMSDKEGEDDGRHKGITDRNP